MKKEEVNQVTGILNAVEGRKESGKKAIYEDKDGKVIITSQELLNALPAPLKSALNALVSVGAAELRGVSL